MGRKGRNKMGNKSMASLTMETRKEPPIFSLLTDGPISIRGYYPIRLRVPVRLRSKSMMVEVVT